MSNKEMNFRSATKEDLRKLSNLLDKLEVDISEDKICKESKQKSAVSMANLIRLTCSADPENGPDIVANKIVDLMDNAIITAVKRTLKETLLSRGYSPVEEDENE